MLLVLRKTGAGTSNPYIADSVAIAVPLPEYEITDSPLPVCQMDVNTYIGDQSINGYTYLWDPSDYLGNPNITPTAFTYDYQANPRPDDSQLTYFVTVTRPNGCVSKDTVFVTLKGIPSVDDIKDTVVCHKLPLHISFKDMTNSNPSLNPTTFGWTVTDGADLGLPSSGSGDLDVSELTNPTSSPVTATVTVTPVKNGCQGVSKTFTVTVRPQLLYSYPDIRVRACPDAGTIIRLSKYIDTFDIKEIQWSPPLGDDGSIAASQIASSHVRTFTYSVTNPCVTGLTRKIYLETLKPNGMRPLSDSVMICYEVADAVQINQIFGIDAGGTWEYYALKPDNTKQNIGAHVKESHSSAYAGAVVMDGRAIYNDGAIDFYGTTNTKKIVFIYTPAAGSCLSESYTVTIILTATIV
jgi:hypothetical protein